MSLNIKNAETCQLANEFARLTGDTMTGAITIALREWLERERRVRGTAQRLHEFAPSPNAARGCCGRDRPLSSMATCSTTSVACRVDHR